AEHDDEHADPRQARPAVLLEAPLPAVDVDPAGFRWDRFVRRLRLAIRRVHATSLGLWVSFARNGQAVAGAGSCGSCAPSCATPPRSSSSSTLLNPKADARRPG